MTDKEIKKCCGLYNGDGTLHEWDCHQREEKVKTFAEWKAEADEREEKTQHSADVEEVVQNYRKYLGFSDNWPQQKSVCEDWLRTTLITFKEAARQEGYDYARIAATRDFKKTLDAAKEAAIQEERGKLIECPHIESQGICQKCIEFIRAQERERTTQEILVAIEKDIDFAAENCLAIPVKARAMCLEILAALQITRKQDLQD